MKFSFSSNAFADSDAPGLFARAAAWGFDGVELSAAQVASDPAAMQSLARRANVAICCLTCDARYRAEPQSDQRAAETITRAIELAATVGCPTVQIFDVDQLAGHDRGKIITSLAGWLLPLADRAAGNGIQIVIANALSLLTARLMWGLLDAVGHPSVGASWDIAAARSAGESPAVSMPTLNSKILHVKVRDMIEPSGRRVPCKLGEGTMPVEKAIKRLRGIGYKGYATVDYGLFQSPGADANELLPDALAKLRHWDEQRKVSDAEAAAGIGGR